MAAVAATFATRLEAARGRPSGFDYMRLILALLVVVMHAALTSHGQAADVALWQSPARIVMRAIVPVFFILSGFLVAGSLERCRTLFMFIGLRAIRIYPALAVEVLLSAILIGPMVTTLPLRSYFSDGLFFRYLVNVTGHISFALPGMFEDNPLPGIVNGQLWTVPFELYCYAVLLLVSLAGLRKWRALAPLAVVGVGAIHLAARLYRHDGHYEPMIGVPPGPLLIGFFLAGVATYLYRERIPASGRLCAIAAITSAMALYDLPLGEYVAIPCLSYVTCYLGLCNPARGRLTRGADYSYGIYLYGFVIQQLVMFALPDLRDWWWNIIICLPLSALCAAASWHLIEKRAMKLKPMLDTAETHWLRAHGLLAARIGPARAAGTVPPPSRVP